MPYSPRGALVERKDSYRQSLRADSRIAGVGRSPVKRCIYRSDLGMARRPQHMSDMPHCLSHLHSRPHPHACLVYTLPRPFSFSFSSSSASSSRPRPQSSSSSSDFVLIAILAPQRSFLKFASDRGFHRRDVQFGGTPGGNSKLHCIATLSHKVWKVIPGGRPEQPF